MGGCYDLIIRKGKGGKGVRGNKGMVERRSILIQSATLYLKREGREGIIDFSLVIFDNGIIINFFIKIEMQYI